jgi:hypothetical protein
MRTGVASRRTTDNSRRMIAEAAYLCAEQRGFSGGESDVTRDWIEAECEIDERLRRLEIERFVDSLEDALLTADKRVTALRRRAAALTRPAPGRSANATSSGSRARATPCDPGCAGSARSLELDELGGVEVGVPPPVAALERVELHFRLADHQDREDDEQHAQLAQRPLENH